METFCHKHSKGTMQYMYHRMLQPTGGRDSYSFSNSDQMDKSSRRKFQACTSTMQESTRRLWYHAI
jgi:hypothetical protein